MKKTLSMALASLSACFMLTGCSIFATNVDESKKEENKEPVDDSIKFVVYDGDACKEYKAYDGRVVNIVAPYKSGSYFMGAYDRETGGTQYFDSTGKSTMLWTDSLPDTFYAQYGDLADIKCLITERVDSPYEFNGNGTNYFALQIKSGELINGIKGNLNKDLYLDVSYELSSNCDWGYNGCYISDKKSGGEKYYLVRSSDGRTTTGKYEKIHKVLKVPAGDLKSGEVYFVMESFTNILTPNWHYLYRNISISITFTDPEQSAEGESGEAEARTQTYVDVT